VRILLILMPIILAACAAAPAPDASSVFPYNIVEEAVNSDNIRRVVIASVNYGEDSPSYLRVEEKYVDAAITQYLESNGYQVLTGNQFDSQWSKGIDTYGKYFDPSTTLFRRDRFNSILGETLDTLKSAHDVDAVIFTDLVVQKVNFDYRQPHYANWDGVRRKPRVKGSGGIPGDYSWAKTFRASSLQIVIFDWNKRAVFSSRGGVELIDNLNTKSGTPKATRNDNLFNNEKQLAEGIGLALHPFVVMQDYPKAN